MKEEKESVHTQLKEKINVQLWHDFLGLCEKYEKKMEIKHFLYCMISFTSRMIMHCCPSKKRGYELIKSAVKYAVGWDRIMKIKSKKSGER